MNIHTFKDAVTSRRSALADEVEDDEDEDNVGLSRSRAPVEGEEDDGAERFNEAGVPIEPFNMRTERESGFIDDNMNYVFKSEKTEVDAWVADLKEAESENLIGEAALAERRRAAKIAAQEKRLDDLANKPTSTLKEDLLSYMIPGETVTGTLRRLSGKPVAEEAAAAAAAAAAGIKRRRPPPTTTATDPSVPKKKLSALEQQRLARQNHIPIGKVTELADLLLSRGLTGIYAMSYEALEVSQALWEYKGLVGQENEEMIYGPFTSQQISQWKKQGFLTGPTAVMMRRVAQPPVVKKAVNIYDDDEDDGAGNNNSSILATSNNAWMNSDAIDFGDYVNLEEEDKGVGSTSALASSSSSKQSDKEGSNIKKRVASDQARSLLGLSGTNSKGGDGEDDGDEEEDDEFDEDRLTNKKRKRRGGINREADEEDGEDGDDE